MKNTPEKKKRIPLDSNNDLIMYGSIAGVSSVALMELMSISPLENFLLWATFCFCISLPISVNIYVGILASKRNDKSFEISRFFLWTPTIAFGLAFALIVFHLSLWAGVVLLVSFIASIFMFGANEENIL